MTPFADLRIETPRLTLRPLADADADDLFGIFSDPAVMRYWSSPPWTERAQALRLIESDREALTGRCDLRLGLELRDSGRVVGTLSLFKIDAGCRRAEIGYGLSRAQQGHGLMHEALSAVVGLAFDHRPGTPFDDLLLNRLEADIDPRNAASAQSLTRLGFQFEGLLRERWQVAGEVSDSGMYGLLRADWLQRTAPPKPADDTVGGWPVRAAVAEDSAGWLALRQALWPDGSEAEHRAEIAQMLAEPQRFAGLLVRDASGRAIGLAELALRHDYVLGTERSPVGFLEGLYVVPEARRQGVARALVAAARGQVRTWGAIELASDSLQDNPVAHAAHRGLGFQETERVVAFKMPV